VQKHQHPRRITSNLSKYQEQVVARLLGAIRYSRNQGSGMTSLVLMEKGAVLSILMGLIGSSVVMGKAQTRRVGTFHRSHPVRNWHCHNRHWVSG